jgi:hypothetical protein
MIYEIEYWSSLDTKYVILQIEQNLGLRLLKSLREYILIRNSDYLTL